MLLQEATFGVGRICALITIFRLQKMVKLVDVVAKLNKSRSINLCAKKTEKSTDITLQFCTKLLSQRGVG